MVFNLLTLSSILLCHFYGMSLDIHGGMIWMMLEWGKFLMEKILIILIPCSSQSFLVIVKCIFCHLMVIQILNDLRMKEIMLEWLFLILGWWLNDWNEGGMRKFLKKGKCPRFFSLSFHSHSYYIYHLTLIQCLKWTWNGFQSFHTQFCTILMSSHHSSVIPSFRVHFNVIHKFCCLSIIPHSFPCHSIILISFLPFYSYSIVIQDILQSFCHSHIICHHSVSPPCPCPKV